MNPFQTVSFRNVIDFLDYLPEDELKVTERLREIIIGCIPDVKEKLAYNVPFYYRHSRICYIWPGAVQWGQTRKKGVDLGFCKGFLLADPSYLTIGGRKEIYIRNFSATKEIDVEAIRQLLLEAMVIDEEIHKAKKGRKRTR